MKFPLDVSDTVLLIIQVACAMPAIWVIYWLILGTFKGGVRMSLSNGTCAIGLVWVAALVLLVSEQII